MDIEGYKIILYVVVVVSSLGPLGLMLRRTKLLAYKPTMVRVIKTPADLVKRFKSNHIL